MPASGSHYIGSGSLRKDSTVTIRSVQYVGVVIVHLYRITECIKVLRSNRRALSTSRIKQVKFFIESFLPGRNVVKIYRESAFLSRLENVTQVYFSLSAERRNK